MQNRNLLPTVIFCHHPCPDGTAGLLRLKQKLGTGKQITYSGLNHTAPAIMEDKINKTLATQPDNAHIIFVDIAPPIAILITLLKKHRGPVTILDHHATAINEINQSKEQLAPYVKDKKLELILDLARSGAGIAHDYVASLPARTGSNPALTVGSYSDSIALAQTVDLLTATGNPKVIQQFHIDLKSLHPRHRTLLKRLSAFAKNEQVQSEIAFYVTAAAFDIEMNRLFSKYNNEVSSEFINEAESFFDAIDIYGYSTLLDYPNLEKAFMDQLTYQQTALKNASTFPSPLHVGSDILYIPADIKCGRTFDPLIATTIKSLSRPALALVANVTDEKSIKESNWVALRAADDKVNLFDVASEYKLKGFAMNAGGHSRASALQCNREQMRQMLQQLPSTHQLDPRIQSLVC